MTREELQQKFERETVIGWMNSQGEPDIDYVIWLEDKILSLPPAEGAEEILDRYLRDYPWQHWGRENALKAMQEFATLHAQRIADKMVSERLRGELIAYDRWMSSQKWGVRELSSPETTVNEYLNTREK